MHGRKFYEVNENMSNRIRIPEVNYKFATGTTRHIPKEWEEMVGIEFIEYIRTIIKRR